MTISNESIKSAFDGFDPDDKGGGMLVLFHLIAKNGVSDPADNDAWDRLVSMAASYGGNADVDYDTVMTSVTTALLKIGEQRGQLENKPRSRRVKK